MTEPAGAPPATWPAGVVKAYLLLVGVVIAIGAGLAALLAAEMWGSSRLFSEDLYNQAFTAHGALSVFGGLIPLGLLLVANLVVADVLRPVQPRLRALPWIGFGACVLAVGSLFVSLATPVVSWLGWRVDGGPIAVFYAIAFGSTAASAIAAFGRRSGPLGPAGLAAAWGSIVCLLWSAVIMTAMAVWIAPIAPGDAVGQADAAQLWRTIRLAWSVAIASLLPHAVERATGKRFGAPWAIAAVALSFAASAVSASLGALATFVGAAIAVLFTARALVGASRPLSVASHFAMCGVVPMVALHGLFDSFLGALNRDVPLHDTFFAVAGFHAHAFACLAIVFTALLAAAGRLRLEISPGLARASAWLLGAGAIVFIAAMAHAGANGRARRYGEYDPVFELAHRIAAVGTVAMVLGGILLVAAFVRRRAA